MFDVKLTGVDALLKKFDAVAAQVHSLQYTIPREFTDWRSRGHEQPVPEPAGHPARAQAARHQAHLEPRPRQGPEASAPEAPPTTRTFPAASAAS